MLLLFEKLLESLFHFLQHIYLLIQVLFTEIKFDPDSLLIALANNVFPHPGGPYNNIPEGDKSPNFEKFSGKLIGSIIEY